MFNIINYIRDVIDLVRNPPGMPTEGCVITENTIIELGMDVEPIPQEWRRKGDYLLFFENDIVTVVPKKDFSKYYAFVGHPDPEGRRLTPVVQIKKL